MQEGSRLGIWIESPSYVGFLGLALDDSFVPVTFSQEEIAGYLARMRSNSHDTYYEARYAPDNMELSEVLAAQPSVKHR